MSLLAGVEFAPWKDDIRIGYVRGERALATWRALRGMVEETGAWPVLVGDEPLHDIEKAYAEKVEAHEAGDLDRWFDDRAASPGALPDLVVDPELLDPEELDDEPAAVTDADSVDLERCAIMLLPTLDPVGGVVVRGFACGPPGLSAVLHRWHEKYGTELLSLGADYIELIRRSPVADPDLAVIIAREIALVAPDVVRQGTETVQALAEEIMGRRIWFLWWDVNSEA